MLHILDLYEVQNTTGLWRVDYVPMVKIQVFWEKNDLRQSMLVSTLKMKGKHARLSKADK